MTRRTQLMLFYTSLLLFIGIMISVVIWNLHSSVTRIEHLGQVINVAGKQRMLSQKILALSLAQEYAEAQALTEQLITDQNYLLSAVPLSGRAGNLKDSQNTLYSIYHEEPHRLIKNMSLYIEAALTKGIIEKNNTTNLFDKSAELLSAYDAAVSAYQALYESEVRSIKNLLTISLLSTVILLIVIGYFVCRPLANALVKVEQSFKEQALKDPLTSLYNRRGFMLSANTILEITQRYKRPLSVICIDIDHFKIVNDTYGHDIGDSVLIHIANTLVNSVRSADIVGRFGGEEFVVILPEAGLDEAENLVAEKIRKEIERTPLIIDDNLSISVTVSLGVSTVESFEQTPAQAIERADKALYTAKNSGRNLTVRYGSPA